MSCSACSWIPKVLHVTITCCKIKHHVNQTPKSSNWLIEMHTHRFRTCNSSTKNRFKLFWGRRLFENFLFWFVFFENVKFHFFRITCRRRLVPVLVFVTPSSLSSLTKLFLLLLSGTKMSTGLPLLPWTFWDKYCKTFLSITDGKIPKWWISLDEGESLSCQVTSLFNKKIGCFEN